MTRREVFKYILALPIVVRAGGGVSRLAHNQEELGATPRPATKQQYNEFGQRRIPIRKGTWVDWNDWTNKDILRTGLWPRSLSRVKMRLLHP